MRSFAEAASLLSRPGGRELFSPLTGEGVLLVDLALGAPAAVQDRAAFARCVATLPAPAIALDRAASASADAFDVVVHSEDALTTAASAVARNPLASLVLVELLRRGQQRSVDEALLDESLAYSTLQSGPEFSRWLANRGSPKPRPPASGPALRVARQGETLELTLARPEKRNAFSSEMRDALCEALELAVADESVRRILWQAEGPAFCSGGDLAEFGTLADPASAHVIRSTRNAGRLLAACAERVEVRLHGACVGAGIELAAFCSRILAQRDTAIRLPEIGMGLVPGAGGTCSIPRRIGRHATAWLALTGEPLDAEGALRLGLVDALAP